jgi:hypothetical protein
MATFQTLSPGNIGRTVGIVDEAAGKMHAIARPTAVKARTQTAWISFRQGFRFAVCHYHNGAVAAIGARRDKRV